MERGSRFLQQRRQQPDKPHGAAADDCAAAAVYVESVPEKSAVAV